MGKYLSVMFCIENGLNIPEDAILQKRYIYRHGFHLCISEAREHQLDQKFNVTHELLVFAGVGHALNENAKDLIDTSKEIV
jgi:hypothetical protein